METSSTQLNEPIPENKMYIEEMRNQLASFSFDGKCKKEINGSELNHIIGRWIKTPNSWYVQTVFDNESSDMSSLIGISIEDRTWLFNAEDSQLINCSSLSAQIVTNLVDICQMQTGLELDAKLMFTEFFYMVEEIDLVKEETELINDIPCYQYEGVDNVGKNVIYYISQETKLPIQIESEDYLYQISNINDPKNIIHPPTIDEDESVIQLSEDQDISNIVYRSSNSMPTHIDLAYIRMSLNGLSSFKFYTTYSDESGYFPMYGTYQLSNSNQSWQCEAEFSEGIHYTFYSVNGNLSVKVGDSDEIMPISVAEDSYNGISQIALICNPFAYWPLDSSGYKDGILFSKRAKVIGDFECYEYLVRPIDSIDEDITIIPCITPDSFIPLSLEISIMNDDNETYITQLISDMNNPENALQSLDNR